MNANTPIENIRRGIVESPELHIEECEAIGGFTGMYVHARQTDGESQRRNDVDLPAANDDYLSASE